MEVQHHPRGEGRFDNGTPSTPSRIKAKSIENAFPTPPQQAQRRSYTTGGISPVTGPYPLSLKRAATTPPEYPCEILDLHRMRSNSNVLPNSAALGMAWRYKQPHKNTSHYFDEVFALREPANHAKDRITRDSIIIAEARLNCCLESEEDFLIDLSFQLAELFQRPVSSIMVIICTDVHILMGGSPDPSYFLTITALPSELAATKNKRSAHILQRFFKETIQVPPNRGILKFESIAEENIATNGVTVSQEIERLEKLTFTERQHSKSISRQTHVPSNSDEYGCDTKRYDISYLQDHPAMMTTSPEPLKEEQGENRTPAKIVDVLNLNSSVKSKLSKRKSILGFLKFGRGSVMV